MATRLLDTLTDPVEGLAGPDFYAYFLDQKNLFEYNDQFILDTFRLFLDGFFGRGVIWGSYTPPLLTAGTGLQVEVAAHTSLIQGLVALTGTTVWVVPDNSTSYLWELQTNTDDTPQYAIVLDTTDPSTDDLPALLLGEITSAGGVITDVVEDFNIIYPTGSNNPVVTEIFGPTQTDTATTHLAEWDADTMLRTGGTVSASVEVNQDVDETKPITILRGDGEDVTLAKDRAWTFTAPRTFNLVDGKRPINNTTDTPNIQEDLNISYTPL